MTDCPIGCYCIYLAESEMAERHSAISVATFGSVTHKKCVAPMRIFSVPNGCSTVSRRVRMAFGFLSSRA